MFVFKAHDTVIYSVAFSPDGELLAMAANGSQVRVWDVLGEPLWQQLEVPGSVLRQWVAFSPDGKRLGWVGRGARVWDVATFRSVLLADAIGSLEQCCFSPDGAVFIAQGSEYPVRRWEASTGRALPGGWGGTREENNGERFPLGCVDYAPDGSSIASGFGVRGERGFDSVVYLYDAASGAERAVFRAPHANAHPTAITYSPDGRYLAGIYGPHLRIWNVADRMETAHRNIGKKHFKGLAFTPDGTRLVTVSNDETVRLWDTSSWNEVGGFEWKVGKLGCVAVSPDGMKMAAGGSTGKVVIWDVD
jgi:WD40 repeat protein